MTKRFQKKQIEETFELPVWEWEYVGESSKEEEKDSSLPELESNEEWTEQGE